MSKTQTCDEIQYLLESARDKAAVLAGMSIV